MILRVEGTLCTLGFTSGLLPSEDTTLLTTRPLPVEATTGGLGAGLFVEAGLDAGLSVDAEADTGLRWCLGIFSGGRPPPSSVLSPSEMDTLGPAEVAVRDLG